MKRFCLVLILFAASSLFAAYPDEYPAYLRMLGFSKKEIRDLRDGRIVIHTHKQVRPGERGISAARVFDVPGYFIRDYRVTSDGRCPACATAVPGRWDVQFTIGKLQFTK